VRSRLSFQLGETMGWATLEPLVDGRPLSQLAEAFERERGLGKPGGYGGFCVEELAPSGQACFPPAEQDPSRTMVLACGCTVPGCWPLTCRVEVGPDEVVWHDFSNPHVDGDYTGLGPITFDREEYEAVLRSAAIPAPPS
jgi:hypothetical protein